MFLQCYCWKEIFLSIFSVVKTEGNECFWYSLMITDTLQIESCFDFSNFLKNEDSRADLDIKT